MSRRSVYLGGNHLHKLFSLPVNNSISPQRMAELAIGTFLSNPLKSNILLTMNVIFIDENGKVSAELIYVLDMILQRMRNNDIPFGRFFIIYSMDHNQLTPVFGKLFLVSSHILSCFKMVRLQQSVCAFGNLNFELLQVITQNILLNITKINLL